MITQALQDEICKAMGTRITAIAPLSAANNAHIYRLSAEGGVVFVAKVAEKGLDTEAWMLGYLREKTQLPVPRIHYSNEHVIVMQFIESQHYTLDALGQRDAAEKLAALHQIKAPKYGFERDTLVGSMTQPNPESADWAQFFAQHRLMYMAGEALKEGKIDAKTMKMVEKLAGKVAGYLKDPNAPALIHGDVWSGNVLAGRGRVAAFLDPAIYHADPEIELAAIRLFSTFDGSFFARYNDINPIKPGFEERAEIYSLYPLLVHTRLFGASYARKAHRVLEKFV
jgi:fructosamine-3-kinase